MKCKNNLLFHESKELLKIILEFYIIVIGIQLIHWKGCHPKNLVVTKSSLTALFLS